jgi:hypothetical protein
MTNYDWEYIIEAEDMKYAFKNQVWSILSQISFILVDLLSYIPDVVVASP